MTINRREAIRRAALMTGGLVFAPNVLAVLEGARARPGLGWSPKLFSEDEAGLVAELTDLILPSTDTPGARELGIPAFVEEVVADVYSEDDRTRFLDGLRSFNAKARQELGGDFVDLDPEQKYQFAADENRTAVEIAEKLVSEDCYTWEDHVAGVAMDREPTDDDTPFFLVIKELTLVGYFTTEVGATQVLQYEAIPGRYDPCAPLEEVGRTWAT